MANGNDKVAPTQDEQGSATDYYSAPLSFGTNSDFRGGPLTEKAETLFGTAEDNQHIFREIDEIDYAAMYDRDVEISEYSDNLKNLAKKGSVFGMGGDYYSDLLRGITVLPGAIGGGLIETAGTLGTLFGYEDSPYDN